MDTSTTSNHTEWSVFAGGPSAGKTTITRILENLGYRVKYDVVRSYIESKITEGESLEIIRGEAIQFHRLIADLFETSESSICHKTPHILENGMPDVLSYLSLWVSTIPQDVRDRVMLHRRKYKNIFIFEPLASFEKDGIRAEDATMARMVFKNATTFYAEAGYDPIIVPRFCDGKDKSITKRIDFISAYL